MKLLHFDSHIAGAKTLWILLFQKDDALPTFEKPQVDYLVPVPFDPDQWMVVPQKIKEDLETSMTQFQKLCEETVIMCRSSKNLLDSAEKLRQVTEEINHFTLMIKIFNEIMKRFKPDQNPKDGPLSN